MIELGYSLLTVLMAGLTAYGASIIFRKGLLSALTMILLWIFWLYFLSGTDLILDTSLPPKFVLLVFLPWILFTIYFYRKHKRNPELLKINPKWPVLIQSFRIIVELLLLYTFYKGIVPESATFEGLNFDILMGITAIPMAFYVYSRLSKFRTLAYAWNILGIMMILFVAFIIASSFFLPSLWSSEESLVSTTFFRMPYLLLAGFLAPLGIFIHVFSLAQLSAMKVNVEEE